MHSDWKSVDPVVRALIGRLSVPIAALPGAQRMVLYGSYAKGTQSADSDVDLAVFFSEANSLPLLAEYRCLARICATSEFDVQVQAFSAGELENPCGIVEEIVRYGVELKLRPRADEAFGAGLPAARISV